MHRQMLEQNLWSPSAGKSRVKPRSARRLNSLSRRFKHRHPHQKDTSVHQLFTCSRDMRCMYVWSVINTSIAKQYGETLIALQVCWFNYCDRNQGWLWPHHGRSKRERKNFLCQLWLCWAFARIRGAQVPCADACLWIWLSALVCGRQHCEGNCLEAWGARPVCSLTSSCSLFKCTPRYNIQCTAHWVRFLEQFTYRQAWQ